VFTRSGSTWTPQGSKLTGIGATANALFGFSVALSADGNTALIGGFNDSSYAGAAWVFTRSGSAWTPQTTTKLTGANEIGNGWFGFSVALSADGNTALIGGPNDNSYAGAAWVFTRAGRRGPRRRRPSWPAPTRLETATSAAAWRCRATATPP
jgi:hypothetical protein